MTTTIDDPVVIAALESAIAADFVDVREGDGLQTLRDVGGPVE